jgi:hypothetical protein
MLDQLMIHFESVLARYNLCVLVSEFGLVVFDNQTVCLTLRLFVTIDLLANLLKSACVSLGSVSKLLILSFLITFELLARRLRWFIALNLKARAGHDPLYGVVWSISLHLKWRLPCDYELLRRS